MPATVHALADRGFIREGAWADLLVIDRDRAARRRTPAWRATSPPTASATSSTPRATPLVVVNGELLLENGRHTGALPGHVLRGG